MSRTGFDAKPGPAQSTRRYVRRLFAVSGLVHFAAIQNKEAQLSVSIVVIIITMVIPALVLGAVVWIFFRAWRRDADRAAAGGDQARPVWQRGSAPPEGRSGR